MWLSAFFSLLFSSHTVNSGWDDSNKQILDNFKANFKNSKSDIIFFLDVSGSVRSYGFKQEKLFVQNLLAEFNIAYYATRVVVITFGARTKTDINYLDLTELSNVDTTKCEFKNDFKYKVTFRNGYATDILGAIRESNNVLQEAIDNQVKRQGVHTVGIMITDGHWNTGDPRSELTKLKNNYNVDVFSIGVGYASQSQLRTIASSNDKVLYAHNFDEFRQLANYIRGGKLQYIHKEPFTMHRLKDEYLTNVT